MPVRPCIRLSSVRSHGIIRLPVGRFW